MNLIPNEKILMESDNKELVLTTHRLRHAYRQKGEPRLTSLTLEALRSCELRRISHPFWLYLGVFYFLLGLILATYGGVYLLLGLILAAMCLYTYYASRRQVLRLASAGGAIVADVAGLSQEAITEFVDAAESAKIDLLLHLHSQ